MEMEQKTLHGGLPSLLSIAAASDPMVTGVIRTKLAQRWFPVSWSPTGFLDEYRSVCSSTCPGKENDAAMMKDYWTKAFIAYRKTCEEKDDFHIPLVVDKLLSGINSRSDEVNKGGFKLGCAAFTLSLCSDLISTYKNNEGMSDFAKLLRTLPGQTGDDETDGFGNLRSIVIHGICLHSFLVRGGIGAFISEITNEECYERLSSIHFSGTTILSKVRENGSPSSTYHDFIRKVLHRGSVDSVTIQEMWAYKYVEQQTPTYKPRVAGQVIESGVDCWYDPEDDLYETTDHRTSARDNVAERGVTDYDIIWKFGDSKLGSGHITQLHFVDIHWTASGMEGLRRALSKESKSLSKLGIMATPSFGDLFRFEHIRPLTKAVAALQHESRRPRLFSLDLTNGRSFVTTPNQQETHQRAGRLDLLTYFTKEIIFDKMSLRILNVDRNLDPRDTRQLEILLDAISCQPCPLEHLSCEMFPALPTPGVSVHEFEAEVARRVTDMVTRRLPEIKLRGLHRLPLLLDDVGFLLAFQKNTTLCTMKRGKFVGDRYHSFWKYLQHVEEVGFEQPTREADVQLFGSAQVSDSREWEFYHPYKCLFQVLLTNRMELLQNTMGRELPIKPQRALLVLDLVYSLADTCVVTKENYESRLAGSRRDRLYGYDMDILTIGINGIDSATPEHEDYRFRLRVSPRFVASAHYFGMAHCVLRLLPWQRLWEARKKIGKHRDREKSHVVGEAWGVENTTDPCEGPLDDPPYVACPVQKKSKTRNITKVVDIGDEDGAMESRRIWYCFFETALGHAISNAEIHEYDDTSVSAGKQYSSQYGSITNRATTRILFDILKVQSYDTFVDFGSGMGYAVMQAAITVPCTARGIEFVETRHRRAVELQGHVEAWMRTHCRMENRNTAIEFIKGDIREKTHTKFLTQPATYGNGEQAGVIKAFVNNFNGVFSTRHSSGSHLWIDDYIAALFAQMPKGSMLFSLDAIPLPLTESRGESGFSKERRQTRVAPYYCLRKVELGKANESFSWSENGGKTEVVYGYLYTRMDQGSEFKDPVQLCRNDTCMHSETPFKAYNCEENKDKLRGATLLNNCPNCNARIDWKRTN